jgi:3-methyladenine DNA glycosylase AlkC
VARRPSDVPSGTVDELNAGCRETANLAEALALNMVALAWAVVPEHADEIAAAVADVAGITKRFDRIGTVLARRCSPDELDVLARHRSDTVRGWAAYAIGRRAGVSLAGRLSSVRVLADDAHFGVREWAWLGVRHEIVADPRGSIALLSSWAVEDSEKLRRFASESTRPRGVWCAHIRSLRTDPGPGLAILEPLRADPARYVQDSVANWLNDAGKDRPEWVRGVVARWRRESPDLATERIARRGLRNLD